MDLWDYGNPRTLTPIAWYRQKTAQKYILLSTCFFVFQTLIFADPWFEIFLGHSLEIRKVDFVENSEQRKQWNSADRDKR